MSDIDTASDTSSIKQTPAMSKRQYAMLIILWLVLIFAISFGVFMGLPDMDIRFKILIGASSVVMSTVLIGFYVILSKKIKLLRITMPLVASSTASVSQ